MRYILAFLITVGLIVLVFILILKGFKSSPAPVQTPLVSYANTNTVAQMTIDGPINADQNHEEIQVDVSQFQTQMTIMKGYQGSVVSTKTYLNNQTAYAVFLRALQVAGFSKGNTSPASRDERGFCPGGNRYIFELNNGSKQIERFWTTSCGGQGTFEGRATTVEALFRDQIPDYNSLTENLNIQS